MTQAVTAANRSAMSDAAWAVAQRLGRFGYAEIAAEMHFSIGSASSIVRDWEREGRCAVVQSGIGLRKMFAVTPEGRVRLERSGSPAQNLWTAMRGLRSFSPVDLMAHANTDDVQVTVELARGYCQALLKAGYLKVERTAVPGRREAIYRLIRNTGPRPPRERRVRAIIDDNLAQTIIIDREASA